MQGLRHWYNHRPKDSVESVTLELCDSRDYFATRKENRLNLIVTLKEESCCL